MNCPPVAAPLSRDSMLAHQVLEGFFPSIYPLAAAVALLSVVHTVRVDRGTPPVFAFRFQRTHAIPAVIQFILFAYWAAYFPPVRAYVPAIALQIAYAYVVDATISIARSARYDVSFGPVPLVFSTNLFIWFAGSATPWSYVAVGAAIASKHFVLRKGKHVFNPSVFGLSVVGLVWLVAPNAVPYIDVSNFIHAPPNMLELVFVLSLVPQWLLDLPLVSLPAALALKMSHAQSSPLWTPIFLSISLLATDPATIPRTPLGRVLYGLFVGYGIGMTDTLLEALHLRDYFSKVFPILAGNALVPLFDRIGTRYADSALALPHAFKYRPAHVAAWIAYVTLSYTSPYKARLFWPPTHEYNDTPGIVRTADGRVRAEDNPMFTHVFSIGRELEFWRARRACGGP